MTTVWSDLTFKRFIQCSLDNLVNDSSIYLDDVVVFSPDFDSHSGHLKDAFHR